MAVEIISKNGVKLPKGNKSILKVGFFDTAKYKNGEYVAQVAFWNEYGTISKKGNKHIPPRPFMRNVTDNQNAMSRIFNVAKIELDKGTECDKIAEICGEQLAQMVKLSITGGSYIPNSAYTIAKKGAGKRPLIDTALMLGSVAYKVEK